MSPSSSKRSSSHGAGTAIDKLDYAPPHSPRRLLLAPDDPDPDSTRHHSQTTSYAGSFFEHVAEGIMERDRERMQRVVARWLSFAWAIVNCLCAGSITAYSLYGHLFQSRLHYTQFQVNIVSIVAELGMYLPVPVFGYLCDRLGPGAPSALSGAFFGFGYLLAAFAYKSGPPPSAGGQGWPFGVMVLAFVAVGMGTSCMYLSAVTTCAKNFGRGNAKGIALAVPIAAFGLSGMWQSQIGSRLLYVTNPDGSRGDVDVYRFFLFLGILLLCVGTIGFFALRIMDEEEMIDQAVDELERSGLLAQDEFFTQAAHHHGYGTMSTQDLSDSTFDFLQSEAERLKEKAEEEARKKTWLLNEETRRYILDPTMWWLAGGFFLVTGPGEAFINNLGTIINTLESPHVTITTSPATHVSIVAITSTLARLLTGTLSDMLAPVAPSHQHRRGPDSLANSIASLPPLDPAPRRFTLSRITFLITFAFILSLGQLLLASGWIQNHSERFALVSALIGAGYGAVFSLTPIVVSVVWGVENFGTNWGILAMTPAAGATLWGAVYALVYQRGADSAAPGFEKAKDDVLCYGKMCYAPTFWAMTVSVWMAMGLWMWAWKGPGGWKRRGVAV
ncbi:MFS general substrate transporter [Dothidotthia symphoricarpi CBS 119687]|uniref:Probable transporter MCH1 n=1 Tax=Dothidotthia symphoricarpi CBS 119687 TaxID=1392245 RepID=A0A6A6AJC2_9PLEO|nr:MFS general substrate transporter [Dothidotthia symphoricarpi CBS 119687]KAF2131666.1 MFS general substrate transporter [Dothidotthia symphoricarpi CBS 119687]